MGWTGSRPVPSSMRSAESGQSVATWSGRSSSIRRSSGRRDLERSVVEARLHAPGAVDARARVDQRHLRAGQREQIARAEADVLGAQVAGRVIGDAAERLAEVARQLLRARQLVEVLHQVPRRRGDAPRRFAPEQLRILALEHQRARRARARRSSRRLRRTAADRRRCARRSRARRRDLPCRCTACRSSARSRARRARRCAPAPRRRRARSRDRCSSRSRW